MSKSCSAHFDSLLNHPLKIHSSQVERVIQDRDEVIAFICDENFPGNKFKTRTLFHIRKNSFNVFVTLWKYRESQAIQAQSTPKKKNVIYLMPMVRTTDIMLHISRMIPTYISRTSEPTETLELQPKTTTCFHFRHKLKVLSKTNTKVRS